MKIFKCPKCGATKIDFMEKFSDYGIYGQNPDGSLTGAGRTTPDILGVFGCCRQCGYDWRFRKALQITTLIKDFYERLKKEGA